MHGLRTGALLRRSSLVGFLLLFLFALACLRVGAARAVTSATTITQTAITSPSDPSYFYDATNGSYGGFTVTGTTNSTSPATDQVDINCYRNDGSGYYPVGPPLAGGVSLNADGGFSTYVSYASIEQEAVYSGSYNCQLGAVPAGTDPSDIASYTGPRVFLSVLQPQWSGAQLQDYQLFAAQLDATNSFTDTNWCGLNQMSLNAPGSFGMLNDPTFVCSDAAGYSGPQLQIDGQDAQIPFMSGASLSVSATQDPSNGNMTIDETEPLYVCADNACDSYVSSGVVDDRVIEQANDGKLVLITDTFRSIDGRSHQVVDDVTSSVGLTPCCSSAPIYFQFPGEAGFSTHSSGDTVAVGAGAPGTIYAYNGSYPDGSTGEGRAALTYFTAPTGGAVSFASYSSTSFILPYTLDVPAGGSRAVSIAYATEFSQSGFSGDLSSALDMQTAPTIVITAPAGGSTLSGPSATVSGLVSAASGVRSVIVNGVTATLSGASFSAQIPLALGSNTVQATVTTDSGAILSTSETVTYTPAVVQPQAQKRLAAIWHPIADTGGAARVGKRRERLTGRVIAGSAPVSYYFEFGATRRLGRRTRAVRLRASSTSRSVALTVTGLMTKATYHYRLVATGRYGHAVGRTRTFSTPATRGHR